MTYRNDIISSVKINSLIFPEELMEKMINTIKLSNEINQEIGFVLCTKDTKDNIVSDKFHCKGEECSSIRIRCQKSLLNNTSIDIKEFLKKYKINV